MIRSWLTRYRARRALRAAKSLISTPDRWCQHVAAYDAHGDEMSSERVLAGEPAASYCALGAIAAVTGTRGHAAMHALAVAATGEDSSKVVYWNNAPERTHADVLAAFDRAIASA